MRILSICTILYKILCRLSTLVHISRLSLWNLHRCSGKNFMKAFPGKNDDVAASVIFVASIHHVGPRIGRRDQSVPLFQRTEVIFVHRLTRLDFHRGDRVAPFNQHIPLMSRTIPPEKKIRRTASISRGITEDNLTRLRLIVKSIANQPNPPKHLTMENGCGRLRRHGNQFYFKRLFEPRADRGNLCSVELT